MINTVLKDQISSLGLVMEASGLVHDTIFDYFRLEKDSVIAPNGDKYPLKKIESLSYSPMNHQMALMNGDGSVDLLAGGKFPVAPVIIRDMPVTSSALSKEWDNLFPDWKGQLYYEELEEVDVIDMAMLGMPLYGIQPITDNVIAQYHICLENILTEKGYVGKRFPSNRVMDEVMAAKIMENRRNSFREWVEAHKWDGHPRLRTWFKDTLGASAPPLRGEDGLPSAEEAKYIEDVTEAWFIGAIKRMYQETKHEIVPVLIGAQDAGKSSVLKYMAGSDRWFRDTAADVSDPARFLDTVRGAIIVELAESSSMRGSDNEKLKAFITASSDRLRKAYARRDETYPRHFIMIATSNLDNIFTDVTGNRRFFPLYCDGNGTRPIATEFRGPKASYEVEQLWAEALALYRDGHKWFLSTETKRLAKKVQEFGTVEHPGITAINAFLDNPANGYHTKGSRICRRIIMEEVFHVDPAFAPREIESNYRAWTNSTRHWVKTKPFRYAGEVHRGYERAYLAKEDPILKTAKLVSGYDSDWDIEYEPADPDKIPDTLPEECNLTLEDIIREHCDKHGIHNTGDVFPTDGLTAQEIEAMFINGYIYNLGTFSKPMYRLGFVP